MQINHQLIFGGIVIDMFSTLNWNNNVPSFYTKVFKKSFHKFDCSELRFDSQELNILRVGSFILIKQSKTFVILMVFPGILRSLSSIFLQRSIFHLLFPFQSIYLPFCLIRVMHNWSLSAWISIHCGQLETVEHYHQHCEKYFNERTGFSELNLELLLLTKFDKTSEFDRLPCDCISKSKLIVSSQNK